MKYSNVFFYFLSCLGILVCYYIYILFFTIHYANFEFDERLSPIAQKNIKLLAAKYEPYSSYNMQGVLNSIMQAMPCIKSIHAQWLSYGVVHLIIQAHDPIISINNQYILLENESIIARDYYATYLCDRLYNLTICGSVPFSMSSSMVAGLERCVSEKLFDHYTFYIANEHEWYLEDKDDPNFTLCCNAASLPFDTLQAAYSRLKIKWRKNRIKQAKWNADIRFEDQIVLSMKK